jgi:hypothetical protein
MEDDNKEESQKQPELPLIIAIPMVSTPSKWHENVWKKLNVMYI